MLLVALGVSLPVVAAEDGPPPRRLAVQADFLAVDAGTRSLAARRVVLDVGMIAEIEETVSRTVGGSVRENRCVVRIETEEDESGVIALAIDSLVFRHAGVGGTPWKSNRLLEVEPGTSVLMEVAPARPEGERLVLSLTVRAAPGDELTVLPVPVELQLRVIGVDEDGEVLLHDPNLSTLTGRPALFSFDYPVPAVSGAGVEHVSFEFRLTPGFPRFGRLPMRLGLAGGYPTAEGPFLVQRNEDALLAPRQTWEVPLRPPSGDGPSLRLEVLALWEEPRSFFAR